MAVVKIAGKQFVVKDGQRLNVPYLDLEIGKSLTTQDLLTGKDVVFEIIEQKRSAKVLVVKFRNKSRYLRVKGQRNKVTVVKNINSEKKEVEEPKVKVKTAVIKKSTKRTASK
ncbi:MAG: bL21 family ribosomal protein [bacterium]|nr:bL21 family ribosomal protein [bacterium]